MTRLKLSLLAATLAAALAPAHAALTSAGDLLFTSFNADEDGWAMVALTSVGANTAVFFSDNEYLGGAFNGGESFFKWDSGAAPIAAGTVIRFAAIDVASRSASVGTLTQETVSGSANTGFSQGNETLYAYLGSAAAPTTFLAAISTEAFTTTVANDELVGTGLVVGVNAIALKNSSDFGDYVGARSGLASFAGYAPLLANVANWNDLGDGVFAANVPNTAAFSIGAVPEPESVALLLAGLGVVGFVARRRSR